MSHQYLKKQLPGRKEMTYDQAIKEEVTHKVQDGEMKETILLKD
jgi:hypothetical protein